MKVQFQILIFMTCLNIASGMAIEFNVAGIEYVQPSNPSNITEYPEHFNATEIAEGWGANYLFTNFLGDILSMFQTVYRLFSYLLLGFPMFLAWMGDNLIVDATAKISYNYLVSALYGLFCISASILFIEFISGRYFTE